MAHDTRLIEVVEAFASAAVKRDAAHSAKITNRASPPKPATEIHPEKPQENAPTNESF